MSLNEVYATEQSMGKRSSSTGASSRKSLPKVDTEEIIFLEGKDFTEGLDIRSPSTEELEKIVAEDEAAIRPVDHIYIERMKKEGVTEDLAVKAFIGLFGGSESETRTFLNSKFYSWTEAPTPLDKLAQAIQQGTMAECIELLEGTEISLSWGEYI